MNTTNEKSTNGSEPAKAATATDQNGLGGLQDLIVNFLTGALGYYIGKGTTESLQQREVEELKAKLSACEAELQKSQNEIKGLSGIRIERSKSLPGEHPLRKDKNKTNTIRTIWI